MKHSTLIFLLLGILFLGGCVQKAHLKTVFVTLTIHNHKNIGTVGIRGNGNPLSWENDYPMEAVIKDSVYKANFKTMTAFKFTEIKFTTDGTWELQNKPNRRVYYQDNKDTVFISAVFDQL